MNLIIVWLVGAVNFSVAADTAKDEQAKFQGTWNLVGLEFDGRDVIGEVKDMEFVFKGDVASVKGDYPESEKYSKFTFKLNPAANPKGIDAIISADEEKGAKLPGIYELDKGKLKICLRLIGKDRPKSFTTESGSTRALIILERAKAK